jgi:glycosyltransferase involved in cell wall biosynthesis
MKNLTSIIVPLFNEEENIPALLQAVQEVMTRENLAFEIILVDDGSIDGTYKVIKEEAAKDSRVNGIRFRRNHGQTAAIMAGIEHARGEVCITMDGDLQHDPHQIPEFLTKIKEGYDLVCSYRHKRDDAFLKRFPSKVANYLARKFSGHDLKDFGSTFRAYRTSVAREMPIYGEMHRFIPVFAGMLTDRITEIPITLKPRLHGTSNYGLSRTFRVLSDLVVLLFFAGFFNRPIHIFGYISIILGLPGFTILSWLSVNKVFRQVPIMDSGPLFFLGVMLSLVAVQLFTTGIVCEYLVRIYYKKDNRQPYSLADTTFSKQSE